MAGRELWKREWLSWKRDVYKWLASGTVIMLAVFLLYIIRKSWLFRLADAIKVLPLELQAFLGLSSDVSTGNLCFFMKYALLPLHIALAFHFCWKAAERIRADERNGSIYSMCGQWYSRRQISVVKCVFPFIVMFFGYGTFTLYNILFIMLGDITWQQRLADAGSFLVLWLRVVLVLGLLASVCIWRALCSKSADVFVMPEWLLCGTLTLGNIYKVVDALLWILEYTGHDGTGLQKWPDMLHVLYWVSPLSWVNPFMDLSAAQIILQVILCVGGSIGFLTMGIRGFEKRDL